MRKRSSIINSILAVAVLFAILFQPLHSYEHLAKELSEKKCRHDYRSAHEITHQHHSYDHCFICDFTLANFIAPETFGFSYPKDFRAIPYFFVADETVTPAPINLYLLRGPPAFIV